MSYEGIVSQFDDTPYSAITALEFRRNSEDVDGIRVSAHLSKIEGRHLVAIRMDQASFEDACRTLGTTRFAATAVESGRLIAVADYCTE